MPNGWIGSFIAVRSIVFDKTRKGTREELCDCDSKCDEVMSFASNIQLHTLHAHYARCLDSVDDAALLLVVGTVVCGVAVQQPAVVALGGSVQSILDRCVGVDASVHNIDTHTHTHCILFCCTRNT